MNSTKKISALLLSLLLSGVLLAGCGGGTGNSSRGASDTEQGKNIVI